MIVHINIKHIRMSPSNRHLPPSACVREQYYYDHSFVLMCLAMASMLVNTQQCDSVEYYVFCKEFISYNGSESNKYVLDKQLLDIKALVAVLTEKYIWHKDAFHVTPKTTSGLLSSDTLPLHLYGCSHYGDNVEDEWFIIYLLMELTKHFDGMIARAVDSDGEFLLIEAADHLPSWATPERSEGRVYIYRGAIHIIPVETTKESPPLSILDALNEVWTHPTRTIASKAVQEAIQSRIERYPEKIKELLHRTQAYVPVGVAALLNANPSLIAPAVLAFCNRDPIDTKACCVMRFFPPENRVMRNVTFTRFLYAMILHHQYNPDKRTGWNLPLANDPNFKAHSLGMKLACGFEILLAQVKPINEKKFKNEVALPDKHWQQYVTSLNKFGYFQNFLEGSKDYNVLLEKAKKYFMNNSDALSYNSLSGQELLSLLQDCNIDDIKNEESYLLPPEDESWLELSSQDVDKMLEQRYGKDTTDDSVNDIAGHITKFLNHISDIEGAEHPRDNVPPLRPKRGIKLHKAKGKPLEDSCQEDEGSELSSKVMFDSESFSCAVQNILDFAVPEDSWDLESDGSNMSSFEDEVDMDLDQLYVRQGKEKMPESELKQYMDQMDRELASTTLCQSFETKDKSQNTKTDDSFDDIENFIPVDIDMNAVKNILQSYQAQMGAAGPASNLLGPMGVTLESKTVYKESNE